jgi:SNF2 family DNA or RNA helicase
VFSQFRGLLGLLARELDAARIHYEVLDGQTRRRKDVVRRFQEHSGACTFLISLKTGGVGLNLTEADYVFLLDPWWNPAAESQAIDRAHRIGQTRPVIAYRLLAQDTVEAKVAALQERKRAMTEALFSGAAGFSKAFSREDLEFLLG